MSLTVLTAHCYSSGSNLLYSTHNRLGQLILLEKNKLDGNGVLTTFNRIQLNSTNVEF